MPYSIDTGAWPMVRLNLEGVLSPDDVKNLLSEFEGLLARRERYLTLVDARRFKPDRSLARPFADWVKRNLDDLRTFSLASALVNDSPMFRFLMSAMFLIQPLPHPHMITGSLSEAEAWSRDLLRQNGLLHDAQELAQDEVGT